jgi:predicted permease
MARALLVARLGFSWLDVKLGLRMIFKQPGLTLVAVFALSIGIPASLLPLHIFAALEAPLPFDGADRIVGLRNRNVAEGGDTEERALHDFVLWRDQLQTLDALGAARTDPYNVISNDGRAAPIRGAQMTASGFEILRVRPLAGRLLIPADEVPGAPNVVVIAYDVWQSRLAGAPDAVGSTIRIGDVPHEVVGIMPEGFLFPVNDHLWLPFRHQSTDYERGSGPDVIMFGRLADGVTLEQSQAELTAVGLRTSSQFPATHEHLRPQVLGYTSMAAGLDEDDTPILYLMQLIIFALLAIVCGNVGILILARTARRSGEFAMRTALGASRARIVSQLFVECLLLAVLSAGAGLLLGEFIARVFTSRVAGSLPFWIDFGVSVKTAALATGIAVFCAVIAGVLPTLRATGRGVQRNLQRSTGASAVRFGWGATTLIMAEVALAVGFLTVGGLFSRELFASQAAETEIDAEQFSMGMVRVPWTDHNALENDLRIPEFRARVVAVHEDLKARLASEPGVRGVAMGSVLPGMGHGSTLVEVEGESRGDGFRGHRVMQALVDVDFFAGLGHPVREGRDFSSADLIGTLGQDRTSVIVNTTFVEQVLSGTNPIGRRIRYVVPEGREPGPWYEIVGVVGHLGMNATNPERDEGVYHPAPAGEIHPIFVAVHVGADAASFTPRLREITREVDPDAMIQNPAVLADVANGDLLATRYATLLVAFLALVAIVLSSAGLYALMSFTVSQRTREIGLRSALGARPAGIVAVIARRAVFQLVGGIVLGVGIAALIFRELEGDTTMRGANLALLLPTIAAFVFLVGALACVAPTLRGLRIRPVDALKEG